MAHTPGPWTRGDRIAADGKIDTIPVNACNGDYTVARINCYSVNGVDNAALISAAPELLRCVELSKELIAALKPIFLLIEPLQTLKIDSILNSIDEVLTKAKGE